jgi:hypothetical protein
MVKLVNGIFHMDLGGIEASFQDCLVVKTLSRKQLGVRGRKVVQNMKARRLKWSSENVQKNARFWNFLKLPKKNPKKGQFFFGNLIRLPPKKIDPKVLET